MNRDEAIEVLRVYGDGVMTTPNGIRLVFERQDMACVESIEKLTDEELVDYFKYLYSLTLGEGCFSLSDLQATDLVELEMDVREMDLKPLGVALGVWMKKVNAEQDIFLEKMEEEYNKENNNKDTN